MPPGQPNRLVTPRVRRTHHDGRRHSVDHHARPSDHELSHQVPVTADPHHRQQQRDQQDRVEHLVPTRMATSGAFGASTRAVPISVMIP